MIGGKVRGAGPIRPAAATLLIDATTILSVGSVPKCSHGNGGTP